MEIKKVYQGLYTLRGHGGRIDIYQLRGSWHAAATYRDVFRPGETINAFSLQEAWRAAFRLYRMGY